MLYAYAFLDELVLLYPLYTVLFARTGLSAAQISSLFVLWSLTSLTLEVPSGALADAVSRRALLCLGPLLGAVGFGLWVVAPSYPAFAAGFVLWGAKGALVSGALEALVYDGLDAAGEAPAFGRVWGRAQGFGVVAVLVATVLAAPVLAAGGYGAVGTASVAAGVAGAAVALAFPEHRGEAGEDDDLGAGYVETLRSGLNEVRRAPGLRRAVLLVPAVTAVWGALEEYTPLLAGADGASDTQVPWWQAVLWTGVALGGLAAGRAHRATPRVLALLVAVSAILLVAGAGSGRASGIVLVALAFGLLQLSGVVAQSRLQDALTGTARATVTSVAAFGEEILTVAVYLGYGVLADAGGAALAFAVLGSLYVAVAVWLVAPGWRLAALRPR